MKKQFVSELELISQLSVPNAVIGPISLCFLQLASLIHCREKREERESWGKMRDVSEELEGNVRGGALHVCRGSCKRTHCPPRGWEPQPGIETVRCINWEIMTKRKADGNENAKNCATRVERKCTVGEGGKGRGADRNTDG